MQNMSGENIASAITSTNPNVINGSIKTFISSTATLNDHILFLRFFAKMEMEVDEHKNFVLSFALLTFYNNFLSKIFKLLLFTVKKITSTYHGSYSKCQIFFLFIWLYFEKLNSLYPQLYPHVIKVPILRIFILIWNQNHLNHLP